MPPTDKRGRVHTSTVTVSVLVGGSERPRPDDAFRQRSPEDFRLEWFHGTVKAGGQHHQKNATCARVTHIPTGLVRTAQTRSREKSHKAAMEALQRDLDARAASQRAAAENGVRRAQIGSGGRADEKRRTWRFQAGTVVDHGSGRTAQVETVMGGRFEKLWKAGR